MAKVDSAYDYYISTYANQEVSRYDSHKKSDLRRVYNRMVQNNKEVPLYKIKDIEDAKCFAIDIKEHAKSVQNIVASLSDRYGSFEDSFQKKVAVSSDPDYVDVKYIGDGNELNNTDFFNIKINKLATPQINRGNFIKDEAFFFIPGNYSFDLTTITSSYEFQYSVNQGENNLAILKKLSNLINSSNLGLDSAVISNGDNQSALSLTSRQTGLNESEPYLFTITPGTDASSISAMKTLGINNISQIADNSDFDLNNTPHSSLSNTFSINNIFELTLKKVHDADSFSTIGFKANADAIADNIQSLLDVYNDFLNSALSRAATNPTSGNRLLRHVSALAKDNKEALADIGVQVDNKGTMSIDKNLLSDAITPERADETFQILSDFKESLGDNADKAAIDPLNYVDKVIVTYKNPGHNFNTPYVTSIYSGLMMDNYV